jgi:hypothetical protein
MSPHTAATRFAGSRRAGACLGAIAITLGASALLYPATASAKLPWNEEKYVTCVQLNLADDKDLSRFDELSKACCEDYSGTWNAQKETCEPPPAKPDDGKRTFPGNVSIPPDLANAPTVTRVRPRPLEVPSDIAIAPEVTQAPG